MTDTKPRSAIDAIPKPLMDQYMKREITSQKLADQTGYTAGWLRKIIKRPPITDSGPKIKAEKKLLRAARQAYRQSISNLPAREIAKLANVSLATAYRIKDKSNADKPNE